eukprot:13100494-Alexandrium_andersonii.AAC.1
MNRGRGVRSEQRIPRSRHARQRTAPLSAAQAIERTTSARVAAVGGGPGSRVVVAAGRVGGRCALHLQGLQS